LISDQCDNVDMWELWQSEFTLMITYNRQTVLSYRAAWFLNVFWNRNNSS